MISARVRALVKMRLVQAWQEACSKYRDCRIRHVMHPRALRDNDFTHIGIVKPFRLAPNTVVASAKGDICMIQVLAYDKMTQQSGWFDIVVASQSTLRKCKVRKRVLKDRKAQ